MCGVKPTFHLPIHQTITYVAVYAADNALHVPLETVREILVIGHLLRQLEIIHYDASTLKLIVITFFG